MAQPQAFLLDVGGTLSHRVLAGVPSGTPTAIVYDENGESLGAVTVTNTVGLLTATLTAGMASELGTGYRVRWSYVVGGVSTVEDTTFEVVRAVAVAPCNQTLLLARVPILKQRLPRETVSFDDALSYSWEEICQRIRALGKTPNRVIGTGRFEAAQAYLAASLVAENLSVGTDDPWMQRALHWREMATSAIEAVFASPGWYDVSDDLVPDAAELRSSMKTILSLR